MRNFIQNGTTIDYTVAGSAIKSGDIRMLEDLAAVAVTDGEVDDTIAMNVTGVYELPKGTGAVKQGQKVYVDATAGNITATATGNKLAGTAWEAAAAAAITVLVKLNA